MFPTLRGFVYDPCPTLLHPWSGAAASVQGKIDNVEPTLAGLQRSRAFVGLRHQTKVGNVAAGAVSSNATPFSFPPVADTRRPGTLLEALEHFRKTREGEEELPKEYTVSEEERTTVRHDEWTELGEIPVIDLSRVETDRAGIVKELRSAAIEWGFFQLVNHGLTVDELLAAQSERIKFIELPAEIKQKLGVPGSQRRSYIGDITNEKGSTCTGQKT